MTGVTETRDLARLITNSRKRIAAFRAEKGSVFVYCASDNPLRQAGITEIDGERLRDCTGITLVDPKGEKSDVPIEGDWLYMTAEMAWFDDEAEADDDDW